MREFAVSWEGFRLEFFCCGYVVFLSRDCVDYLFIFVRLFFRLIVCRFGFFIWVRFFWILGFRLCRFSFGRWGVSCMLEGE